MAPSVRSVLDPARHPPSHLRLTFRLNFASSHACDTIQAMQPTRHCLLLLLLTVGVYAPAQIKRTSVPLGDAVSKALETSDLTGENTRPFHIRITVSEPENPQSSYQGSIEEWWVSKDQWRREVSDKEGLHQTIVIAGGVKTEKDEGDYFPLWLRHFVFAAFDPAPNAAFFTNSGATIDQITLPNGDKSDACARLKSKVGSGDNSIDIFSNICFDGQGRLKFYGSTGYDMEFHDYRSFGKKQIAREFSDDPEPGTHLVGKVDIEDASKAAGSPTRFTPLATTDDRFGSAVVSTAQLEKFIAEIPPIAWPTVRSGKTSGHLAIYISVDSQGKVREAWPLTGDNGELHDLLRQQARTWEFKPATDTTGKPTQVEGSLSFPFETHIGNALPTVTGADIQKYVSNCTYKPILPAGLLPSGTTFKIRAGVNEDAKETGESFPEGIPWKVIQRTGLEPHRCQYRQYIENGKPTYYAVEFTFTAP
jgi:hypothetical protein